MNMLLAVKASGLALVVCVCMLLIKKRAPEQALLMAAAAAVIFCAAVLPAAGVLTALCREWAGIGAVSDASAAPVAKCVGLGLLTRLSADLCRDSGSAALASAVEIVGCVCALLAASPLAVILFEMLGGIQ